jgi:hypothetical protein
MSRTYKHISPLAIYKKCNQVKSGLGWLSNGHEGRNLPIPQLELSFQRRLEPPNSHVISFQAFPGH